MKKRQCRNNDLTVNSTAPQCDVGRGDIFKNGYHWCRFF